MHCWHCIIAASYDIEPERVHHKTVVNKNGRIANWAGDVIPARFIYTIYAPEGHVVSTIKGEVVTLSDNEKLQCVTEIKDYYPPAKLKRTRAKAAHDEAKKRVISVKRSDARGTKNYWNKIDGLRNGDRLPRSGFHSFAAIGNGKANGHYVNGYAEAGQELTRDIAPKKFEPAATKGPVRRERTFAVVSVENNYGLPTVQRFSQQSRKSKDRINATDGTYTVLQYTGGAYSAARYTATGGRISLTSYNSEGAALKEIGKQPRAATMPKVRRPFPPDAIARQRRRDNDARMEFNFL